MADVNSPADLLVNGAKLVGDFMLPGVSLTIDGDVKRGAAHAAVAIAAGTFLGGIIVPVVWAAAGLNAYSTSVTGKDLVDQLDLRKRA